jgi:hypothetical protein
VRPLVTILAAGVLLTLIFAWPATVAAQWATHAWGWFPWRFDTAWPNLPAGGRIEFARGIFADWFQMFPSDVGTPDRPSPAWPHGDLRMSDLDRAAVEPWRSTIPLRDCRLPSTVAGPPPADEAMRWGRIDTGLCGFPFRCFRSEAWFPATAWTSTAIVLEPEPELRGTLELGQMGGNRLMLPLRPIWPGLVANVLFWSAATWAAFAIPRSWQVRSRRKRGLCIACAHPLASSSTCPECGGSRSDADRIHPLHQPEMLYPNAYVWFVFVSALDIMLTWKILDKGGEEVNPVAREVIELWGLEGAILFKFAIVVWVVIACELSGRRKPATGRRLAWAAVVVSAAPVVYSLGLLLDHLVLRPVG